MSPSRCRQLRGICTPLVSARAQLSLLLLVSVHLGQEAKISVSLISYMQRNANSRVEHLGVGLQQEVTRVRNDQVGSLSI